MGEPVPEERKHSHMLSSGFYGAGEDNRGRGTDIWLEANPSGLDPTSIITYMPDALPVTTLLIYPGSGQALSTLGCISGGLLLVTVHCNTGQTQYTLYNDI